MGGGRKEWEYILTINRSVSEHTLFSDPCWHHWMLVHKRDVLSDKVLGTGDLSYQIKIANRISAPSTALGAGEGREVEVERKKRGVEKCRTICG